MNCQSSKFLYISILTFVIGIGIVRVWQDFNFLLYSVKTEHVINHEEISKPFENHKTLSLCEKYKDFFNQSSFKAKHTITPSGTLNLKIICLAESVYPPNALAVKASGEVKVEVLVNESGDVISAKAISGHPLLRASAVSTAYKSKFSPSLLGGEIVKVRGIFVVNFILPD